MSKYSLPFHVPILGEDSNMPSASADGVTIINFGMGSANAATVMDLLSAVKPEAVLFLGKCGGIKKVNKLGDYILPIAAIRGEGTSNDYFPPEVPALPAFMLQRQFPQPSGITIETTGPERFTRLTVGYGSLTIISKTIYVAYVVWPSIWKTATLFSVGFANQIPVGALLLVSDQPMISTGVKNQKKVTKKSREIS